MKHSIVWLACAAAILAVTAAAPAQERQPDRASAADDLLRRSDASRSGWESYSVVTTIRNFVDQELKDQGRFEVSAQGADKTLVKFLNADAKGQYLLMVDDAMWIYMPNTRKPIRITPLQRLMGDASNGDVARTRFADDYTATLKTEAVLDGVPCFVLSLTAKRESATYQRIEYWIAKAHLLPKKADISLASGKHYKSIYYDTYTAVGGKLLLSQMTIHDNLRAGRSTVMTFSHYTPQEIPAKYFNKDYLERLR